MRRVFPGAVPVIWAIRFLACLLALLLPAVLVAAEKAVEVGQPVPEFTLPGLAGEPLSFQKDIRGKAPLTLFFFMTTACSACYEELKEIHEFVGKKIGRAHV